LATAARKKASALSLLPPELQARLKPEPFPDWIAPMKATLTEEYFSDPQWLFERKLDGVRIIAYKHGKTVQLLTRNRNLNNHTYPEVVDALLKQPAESFVIDGEVTAFKGKHSSFSLLQDRLGVSSKEAALASGVSIEYYVFDILHLDGQNTLRLPNLARKELLQQAIAWDDMLRFTEHRVGKGEQFYKQACKAGWEGLIAKDAAAPYLPGKRSDAWLKFKCSYEQEFVIGGYTDPQGERDHFGALLLGYYEGGQLHYAGKVGTGFDDKELRDIHAKMSKLETDDSAFVAPRLIKEKSKHWIRPKLVCQVAFTEWTDDGKLRHPRYLGLRTDKPAKDVVREEPKHG
jgi:bifunctional non-homologous end joining protein LigD